LFRISRFGFRNFLFRVVEQLALQLSPDQVIVWVHCLFRIRLLFRISRFGFRNFLFQFVEQLAL
jgi:hypothetical protein